MGLKIVEQARQSVGLRRWLRRIGVGALVAVGAVIVMAATIALTADAPSVDAVASQTVRITVILVIPALLVIVYWLIATWQVRSAKASVRTRFGSEHELLARVSHQVRDELTVIYGFSEALLDSDMTDVQEVRDILEVINAETVDLSRVVDDLVAATDITSGRVAMSFSSFNPSDDVSRVVVPFRRRGHSITIDCWDGEGLSDSVRFRQIVRSMISNAVRHGGPDIAIIGSRSDDAFRCTVADDGSGLPPGVEAAVFGRGTSEVADESDSQSPALGLLVSQALAERLGGTLSYSRERDVTMMTLELPTHDWPSESTTDLPDEPDPHDATREPEAVELQQVAVDDGDGEAEEAPRREPDPNVERQALKRRVTFGDVDHSERDREVDADVSGDEVEAEVPSEAPAATS